MAHPFNLTNIAVERCSTPVLNEPVNGKNQFIGANRFDAAGNEWENGQVVFDGENRASAAVGVTYTYDGDGQRVKKSSGTLYWGLAGNAPLAEGDFWGNVNREFIFFGGKRIALLDVSSGGTVYYYFSDHLGSSSVVTNDTGATIMQESDFYPFGGERLIVDMLATQRYKFTGKERDSETGLDYFGARYYGSSFGRFTSPDPSVSSVRLDNPQTWNRYSYVLNNPLELTDPSGEEWNLGRGPDEGAATWTDTCGFTDDCIKTVAIADNNQPSVTVYGETGDVSTYTANANGVIDTRDVANNPSSQFEVAPQQHPENYLSPDATAALFNTAANYQASYPNDSKLAMTGGSASNGEPATDAAGKPVHQGHHAGNNVDLRYLGKSGQQLTGPTASKAGDTARNKTVINAMRAGGFKGAITGNASKYGSKPVSPSLTKIHQNHVHFQRN